MFYRYFHYRKAGLLVCCRFLNSLKKLDAFCGGWVKTTSTLPHMKDPRKRRVNTLCRVHSALFQKHLSSFLKISFMKHDAKKQLQSSRR